MIVKGDENPAIFRRCLESVARYVDGIFITITTPDTGVKDVAEEFGAHVSYKPEEFFHTVTKQEFKDIKRILGFDPLIKAGDKVFLFDDARNYSFSLVGKEYDWILWLDSDDVLRNAKDLKQTLWEAENHRPQPAESIFMNYIYHAEFKDGQIEHVLIEHLREQIVRNNDSYKWVAPIHETLIEQRPTAKIECTYIDRVHLTDIAHMQSNTERNARALEYSVGQTKGADPRPIYYLGKVYFDLRTEGSRDKALKLFQVYLHGSEEHENQNKSGWAEERSQCWDYCAEIYRARGEHNNALKCHMNALIESDKFPTTYLNIALSFLIKGQWDSALRWVRLASQIEEPDSTLVTNPKLDQIKALDILYLAHLNLSHLDEALEASRRLCDLVPEDQEFRQRYGFMEGMYKQREATKSIMGLAEYLRSSGESYKLQPLLFSAPQTVLNNPFITGLSQEVFPPRIWGDNEVAIYCGPGLTSWSPKNLTEPGQNFVGGSEEAVIHLGEELTKLGRKVTVYGDPAGEEGEYAGVTYLPYFKFNPRDSFNILVSWRRVQLADQGFDAKKLYVWCHDIQNHLEYTPERLERIHKVIVLSEWHRKNIPNVPDEKILVSNNGIKI